MRPKKIRVSKGQSSEASENDVSPTQSQRLDQMDPVSKVLNISLLT